MKSDELRYLVEVTTVPFSGKHGLRAQSTHMYFRGTFFSAVLCSVHMVSHLKRYFLKTVSRVEFLENVKTPNLEDISLSTVKNAVFAIQAVFVRKCVKR